MACPSYAVRVKICPFCYQGLNIYMYGVSIIFLLYLHLFVLKKGKPEKEPEVADPPPEGEVGVQVISSNSLGISDKHLTDSGKTHRQTNGSFT